MTYPFPSHELMEDCRLADLELGMMHIFLQYVDSTWRVMYRA